jgi:haloalkane dehalogenase
MQLLKSFDFEHVTRLPEVHKAINVPVHLVWGELDRFFPVKWARSMVDDFANASLTVIPAAGLFAHEERPAEVAQALLPTLTSPKA